MALRQSIVILRSLFAFLVSQNYLLGNAFAGVALPREQARPLGSRRTLSFDQWDALEERLDEFSGDPLGRRRARAIRWLYATGLRLAEMADAHCGDLQQVDYRLPNGTEDSGWMLSVVGKGDKLRQVPVPVRLVDELQDELEQNGLEADVRHESNRDVAILMRLEAGVAKPWSASGLSVPENQRLLAKERGDLKTARSHCEESVKIDMSLLQDMDTPSNRLDVAHGTSRPALMCDAAAIPVSCPITC